MSIILKAENISKQYRLGLVGTGTLSDDLKRWWYQVRGKEDPFLKVGGINDRSSKAEEDYVWALRNINFEVRQGEVLGIIGKNGAGKSTLLKILSRVTAPTTGSIKTKGRIASLLEIGTGFHPELTGRENIFMNGAVLGMTKSEIRSKLDEIIAFSGCEKYIDTPVKRYSSGMTVRLGFAVAAHLEPEILVVDEVLAVGDAEFQKKAIGKMQDLSTGEGRTVLFVSHNMASVQNLCSDLLILNNGSENYRGAVHEGVNQYLAGSILPSNLNLSERLDRNGGENFRFIGFKILEKSGEDAVAILAGQGYIFRIKYSLVFPLSKVRIRILFSDSRGVTRFLCNSEFSDSFKNLSKTEEGIIECTIPKFPLPKGIFHVNLTCFSTQGIDDDVENVAQFEVKGGDFFKTGREQVSREGVLVENYFSWIIK